MFQSFKDTARPDQAAPRLKLLRAEIARDGLAGFLIPRADAHQGEYVAPHDDRLSWATGFTGSAGFCAALTEVAGVFVDGRYRTQVKRQVDLAHFTPVDWPETKLGDWLVAQLPQGGNIGFDPWLHTPDEIETLENTCTPHAIGLKPTDNLVDRIWPDQPAPPLGEITPYPVELAGETHGAKRARLGETLRKAGHSVAVLTLPDSIAWLLNIRGSDIARNPVPHSFAILRDNGHVALFVDPAKISDSCAPILAPKCACVRPRPFCPHCILSPAPFGSIPKPPLSRFYTRCAKQAATMLSTMILACFPKPAKPAPKSPQPRLRICAMALPWSNFSPGFMPKPPAPSLKLTWSQRSKGFAAPPTRFSTSRSIPSPALAPNGAVMHYRVSENSNTRLEDGQLIVVDSGGQYIDGTTDITRTLPIGQPGDEERRAFTRVLKGMIAVSRARFPKGDCGGAISIRWRATISGSQGRISTMAPATASASISAFTKGHSGFRACPTCP